MPDELSDIFARVPTRLPSVAWLEPDELRRVVRVRRQGRAGLVLFMVVLAIGGLGIVLSTGEPATLPGPGATATPTRAPTPGPSSLPGQIPADLDMPERDQIVVNIYNGSGVDGIGTGVGTELRARGFLVPSTAKTAADRVYDEVAVIRFGPRAVGAAWLMRAYFRDRARPEFEVGRPDATVDIIIGARFDNLATVTEVNQTVARLGLPPPPPGTCASSTRVPPAAMLTAEDIGPLYAPDYTNVTAQEWHLAYLGFMCPRDSTVVPPEMEALTFEERHFRAPDGEVFQFVTVYTLDGASFQMERTKQLVNECRNIAFENSRFTLELVETLFAGEDSFLVKVTPIDVEGATVRYHIFVREGDTLAEIVLIGESLASRFRDIATSASVRMAGSAD